VGHDPNINLFTTEMVIAHEMTHAILVDGGATGSSWGQQMLATYVSGEGDLRIKGDEAGVLAAIGGSLTSDPTTNEQYAAVSLAADFINDVHGAGTLYNIIQGVIGGLDWEDAVTSELSRTYADFAAFETAADAYSTEYVNSGIANGVAKTGLGWTLEQPLTSSQYLFTAQIGPDSSQALNVSTPWLGAGTGDYLAFVNVTTTEQARSSIDSIDRAESLIAVAHAQIGIQERRLRHIINDLETQYINLTAARSRIQDANIAKEITDLTKTQIIQQSAYSTVSQANTNGTAVLTLLNAAMGT
jgi:flagellin